MRYFVSASRAQRSFVSYPLLSFQKLLYLALWNSSQSGFGQRPFVLKTRLLSRYDCDISSISLSSSLYRISELWLLTLSPPQFYMTEQSFPSQSHLFLFQFLLINNRNTYYSDCNSGSIRRLDSNQGPFSCQTTALPMHICDISSIYSSCSLSWEGGCFNLYFCFVLSIKNSWLTLCNYAGLFLYCTVFRTRM